MSAFQRGTGGKRDTPDARDVSKNYEQHQIPSVDEHPVVDLRQYILKIYDQDTLESCTSCVLCGAYGLELKKQSEGSKVFHYFDCSRLFLYYNSRKFDDDTDNNVGVSIRNVFKAFKNTGVCEEGLWPYNKQKYTEKPPPECYTNAAGNTVCHYARLDQNMHQFRACLKEGYPFAFGFEVYDSFRDLNNKKDGLMVLPSEEEIRTKVPGLHAVLAVGYDETKQCIIVLNSWGPKFGDNGYFYMPYSYITDSSRAFDFWKIENVCERP